LALVDSFPADRRLFLSGTNTGPLFYSTLSIAEAQWPGFAHRLRTLLITQLVNVESLRNFALQNPPRIDRLVDVGALRTNRAYYWLSLTLVSFVTAGLREELWRAATLAGMRALWPGAFMSRTGESIAIALIGVAFGAAHLPMGALAAVAAGLIGIFLGIILIIHRSIWPAVIAHSLFDASTFALLPLIANKFPELRP
jgi:membrane protease YdiL (CAAX protease family)